MNKGKKEFKKFLIDRLKGLPRDQQKAVIDGFMESIKEALGEIGIGVIIESANVDIKAMRMSSSSIKEFISMLKDNGVEMPKEELKKGKRDFAIKTVGDSVIVTDKMSAFYMHEYESKVQLCKNFESPLKDFMGTPGIVIETGLEFVFDCGHCEQEHESDLVVYFPSVDKKYYIASKLVKIL